MKHRSKMLQSGHRLQAVTTINMTPLIDLAFALLIIFIIATPLLEQTIPLNLPVESSSPADNPDTKFQTISINRDGQIYWGKTLIDRETLAVYLRRFAQQSNPPVLNIRGDADIRYQAVIDVIDLIKQNKLEKISLDTQAE